MRILIVEDDRRMAAALRRALDGAGVVADVVASGSDAAWMVREAPYDAMVLDVMLPGDDGFEVCGSLRAAGVWVPIIMVTARAAVQDRVRGLDAGADDYLTKPFSLAELLARLRALARRDPNERPVVLAVGSLRLDPATRSVSRRGAPIAVMAREFALLEAFMRRPGQVLSQRRLLDAAWDFALRAPVQRRRGVRALPAGEDRPAVRPADAADRPRHGVSAVRRRPGVSRLLLWRQSRLH